MITNQEKQSLMDEGGITITHRSITTPEGEFPFSETLKAAAKVHRPLWGPFLLASLGTINLAAAVQTTFWGDWLASLAMLGGGLYWRFAGTRHVLELETKEKKVDAWFTRSASERDRALEIIQEKLG